MKRIRITESDLIKLINKIIKESNEGDGEPDTFPEYEGRTDIYADAVDSEMEKDDDDETETQVAEHRHRYKRRRY